MSDLNLERQKEEWLKCALDPVYFLNTYGHVFNAREKRVLPMECFTYQEECVRKFHENQNNIILKSRQCLPKNTFVDTPEGPKAIQSLKIGDSVYSYNIEKAKVDSDKIKDAWCSGIRQCVKFKLQDTRNFEVGENHPFLVKDKGWVKAKDLLKGDEIIDANIDFGKINANEDEIKLLVYLITDGCTNKQVKFTNNNLDYLDEFEKSVNVLFPLLEVRKSPKLKGFDYYPHQSHGSSTINPVMEWCENKKIANKKTEEKLLPTEVNEWDKKSISLLLNRMFAGDGWVSIYKRGNSKRLELGIASPSQLFLEQVKFLLKKFNIKCNIYEVKNMKLQKNVFFKLRITHSKSAIKFIEEIGIYKKINNEHYEICKNYKHNVKDNPIIKKIEKTQKLETYDISVEKNENFLINGLVVHNTGLSVITAAYVAWTIMFRPDQKVLIIANDGVGAVRFLETVKQFVHETPEWLRPEEITTENQKKIQFSNKSYAEAKASSPNAGRGDSPTMLILDETAFIKDIDAIWLAAGTALSMTQGKCIMISTPNGTGNLYHKTWLQAKKDGNKAEFVTSEVHWTQNPFASEGLEQRTRMNGEKYFWSPWYEKECKRLHNDPVSIAQELDLSFEGSKRLAIESELIRKYEQRLLTDEYKDVLKNISYFDVRNEPGKDFVKYETLFKIFKLPKKGHKYVIGGDVASGSADDYSALHIIDIDELEVVGEYQDKIPPDLFAILINRIGRIYNYAYLAIEANNHGIATTLDLNRKMNYERMHFCKSVADIFARPYDYKVNQNQDIPGFQTTKRTRPLVINNLTKHLRDGSLKLYGERSLAEFRNFVQNGDRPEAEKGFNDDLIFALAIGLFIRDTDFENASATQELYKNMIDAIGYSDGTNRLPVDKEALEGAADVLLFTENSIQNEEDDFDDVNWLMG